MAVSFTAFADPEGTFTREVVVSHEQRHRPGQLLATLKQLEFKVAVSVPDSWLGQLLVEIDREPGMTLIRATHEEEALAIACGARLWLDPINEIEI